MKFGHQILKYREDIIRDLTELIAVPSVCTDPVPGKPFGENSAKALETILNMAKKLATVCNLVGLELKDFIVIGAYGYRHSIKEQEFEWLEPSYKWLQEV